MKYQEVRSSAPVATNARCTVRDIERVVVVSDAGEELAGTESKAPNLERQAS